MRRTIPVEKRFWSKVKKRRGHHCWLWIGGKNSKGYGRISRGERGKGFWHAHRLSWTLHFGPVPKGLEVCHECDNPSCVRPDHLFLGTKSQNMQDSIQKGRFPLGERHHNARLSNGDVQRIRSHWPTISMQQLADQYKVSIGAIHDVVHRITWRHV
jgi:hypothetical protein